LAEILGVFMGYKSRHNMRVKEEALRLARVGKRILWIDLPGEPRPDIIYEDDDGTVQGKDLKTRKGTTKIVERVTDFKFGPRQGLTEREIAKMSVGRISEDTSWF